MVFLVTYIWIGCGVFEFGRIYWKVWIAHWGLFHIDDTLGIYNT